MNEKYHLKHQQDAIHVLRHMLVGAIIAGVRFRDRAFTLILTPPTHVEANEVYIYLDTWWYYGPTRIDPPSDHLSDHGRGSLHEWGQLYALRNQEVLDVALDTMKPHLYLTIGKRFVMSLNGFHSHYEPWEVGTAMKEPAHDFLVVATPGGNVAVWAPPGFLLDD